MRVGSKPELDALATLLNLIFFFILIILSIDLILIKLFNYRFQSNHQKHHRDQQNERIDRDMQRNRSQNSPVNNSSNGGAVNNINNRAAGFSRQRDTRDDDYARFELNMMCHNHHHVLLDLVELGSVCLFLLEIKIAPLPKAVTKIWELRFFQATFIGNKRKIQIKELSSCLIPCHNDYMYLATGDVIDSPLTPTPSKGIKG